ncbi:ComEC/Rec2 family competence protein [Gilvibacter sp.]|uniref:ComEC/Rec2 family competence protein n=1 Tax=Gilvibacter sp. TaxID=2729997 RepID=UPI0035BE8EB6
MGFVEFPLVRLGLVLLLGIYAGPSSPFSFDLLLEVVCYCVLLLLFMCFVPLGVPSKTYLFSVLAYGTCFCCGALLIQAKEQRFNLEQEQLAHKVATSKTLRFQIISQGNETAYHVKYEAKLLDKEHSRLRILVRVKKDSSCHYLKIGSSWDTNAKLTKIASAKNPGSFDYAKYMKYQGIGLNWSGAAKSLKPLYKIPLTWHERPALWQAQASETLNKYLQQQENFELLAALLLGNKSQLDPETKQQFATAGIMHLLAVSGLHLGIVLLFTRQVLNFLNRFKYGNKLIFLLTILSIWTFALLTGASVSVLRAATMFSCILFGRTFLARGHSMNSLFVSLWILLLIDPFFAFQLGFELSYMAVFFILWLMPVWNARTPKIKGVKKLWQLCGVSLVAQAGTAPLSLYYFHQFPLYFLLSNLIVLPFVGLVLVYGIISLITVMLWPQAELLFIPLEFAVDLLRAVTKYISELPRASFAVPSFGFAVLLTFLWSSLLVGWTYLKRPLRLFPISLCLCIGLGILIRIQQPKKTSALIISQQFGRTELWQRQGKQLVIYQSDSLEANYSRSAYVQAENIAQLQQLSIPTLFYYAGKRVLIIDGSFSPDLDLEPIDILLLTSNAKIHLERWINRYHPKLIIADGSSYNSNKQRWRATAKKERLPFYDTSQQGAFVFE